MKVRFEGPTDAPTGYGRAAREMAAALGDWLAPGDDADVTIWHQKPQDTHVAPDSLLYTTWETTPFPERFVDRMNAFRAVLVPSEWCRLVLYEAGVERVFVLPHPLAPEFERQTPYPHGTYEFYSIGTWNARKNMEGVLRAYLHEFSRFDDVHLTLLVADAPLDRIHSVLARSGIVPERLPRLHVPDGYYTDAELLALHESCHCYVTAARAEGFGLGAAEAVAFQNRVIAPKHTGLVDAIGGYPAVDWVESQLAPAFPDPGLMRISGNQVSEEGIAQPRGMDCRQSWWDPNLVSLATKMRYAYVNRKRGAPSEGHVYRAEDFRRRLQEIVSEL